MITMTQQAIKKIKDIAKNEEIKELTVRVAVKGGGCAGFVYDLYFEDKKPTDFDEVFDVDGLKIIVDPLSFQYLNECEIDWIETMVSSGFKFNNPNVSASCGCGSSVAF